MPTHLKLTVFATAIAIAMPAMAQSNDQNKDASGDDSYFQLGTGVDYSEGRYGDTQDTKVTSFPISAKYVNGPFSIRASVPYVRISGPGSLLTTPGEGGGEDGGGRGRGRGRGGSGSNSGSSDVLPGGGNRKDSGIGDTNIALNYSLDLTKDLFLDVTGKVKLPTASKTKRLGTGKTDFTAATALTKEFGAASIYVEGRRRFAGSTVASPLRDTWGASAGVAGRVSDGVRIGADYDWQQAAFAGNKASSEVTGWVSFRLSKAFRLQVYGSTGLNNNSVDKAAGISLTYRIYGL